MTNERAIELFKEVKAECEAKQTILSKQVFEHEGIEALDLAIKALEQTSHLIDRPCEACEFYKENGCCKWSCVFESKDGEEVMKNED